MKTIEEYINQIKKNMDNNMEYENDLIEYQSHLQAEYEDFVLGLHSQDKIEKSEEIFVKRLESPNIIAQMLILEGKNQKNSKSGITLNKRHLTRFYIAYIITGLIVGIILFLLSELAQSSNNDSLPTFRLFLVLFWPINLVSWWLQNTLYQGTMENMLVGVIGVTVFMILCYLEVERVFHNYRDTPYRKLSKTHIKQIVLLILLYFILGITSSYYFRVILSIFEQTVPDLDILEPVVWPLSILALRLDVLLIYSPFYLILIYFIHKSLKKLNHISLTEQLAEDKPTVEYSKDNVVVSKRLGLRYAGAYGICSFISLYFSYLLHYSNEVVGISNNTITTYNFNIINNLFYETYKALLWPVNLVIGIEQFIFGIITEETGAYLYNYPSRLIAEEILLPLTTLGLFIILAVVRWERIFLAFNLKYEFKNHRTYHILGARFLVSYLVAGLISMYSIVGFLYFYGDPWPNYYLDVTQVVFFWIFFFFSSILNFNTHSLFVLLELPSLLIFVALVRIQSTKRIIESLSKKAKELKKAES